ncbi:MAG: Fic family protein [Acidobacteriota bacterium]
MESTSDQKLQIDPRRADALYKPFPSFAEWVAASSIDVTRWDRYVGELKKLRDRSPELMPRALEIARRAAAFDTGAIEGLYATDRGFTMTVAVQSLMWEAALDERGPQVRALFQAQLNAYDHILDFATGAVPIAEAWIWELHAQICEAQETYRVWTEIGWQEQALPKGAYKLLPNHPLLADGSFHSYAPVDITPTEMFRFCQELRSQEFGEAHPVLQAAYAHYAFVAIHPFADGNGRVARALGSVFTFRAESIPLLILVDNRGDYLDGLQTADTGDYQAFVDFTLERAFDALQMASESVRAAAVTSIDEAVAEIKRLYKTKGGYTHREIDQAAFKFIELLKQETSAQLKTAKESAGVQLKYDLRVDSVRYDLANPSSRLPLPLGRVLKVNVSTPGPADAKLTRSFGVEVPKDCGVDDDLTIQDLNSHELFEARVTALLPEPNTALRMRLSIWVQKLVGEMLAELSAAAAESLRKKGY